MATKFLRNLAFRVGWPHVRQSIGSSANLFFETLHRAETDGRMDVMAALIHRRHWWQVDALNECVVQQQRLRSPLIDDTFLEVTRDLIVALESELPPSEDGTTAVSTAGALGEHAIVLVEKFYAITRQLHPSLREGIERTLETSYRAFVASANPPAEALPPPLVGLAVSGGGIRSASFSIGAFQALAEVGLLSAVDVVSSVSGGGYASSLLCAWAYRHREGMKGIAAELSKSIDGGPTVQWVRRYCAYLAPSLRSGMTREALGWLLAYASGLFVVVLQMSLLILAALLLPQYMVAAHQWLLTDGPSMGAGLGLESAGASAVTLSLFIGLFRSASENRNGNGSGIPTRAEWRRPPVSFPGLIVFCTVFLALPICVASPMSMVGVKVAFRWLVGLGVANGDTVTTSKFPAILLGSLMLWLASFCVAELGVRLVALLRNVLRTSPPGASVKSRHSPLLRLASTISSSVACALPVGVFAIYSPSVLDDSILVIAFGPLALSTLFFLGELSGQHFFLRYQTDADRTWRAQVMGWMLSACIAWAVLCMCSFRGMDLLVYATQDWVHLAPLAVAALALLAAAWRLFGAAITLYLAILVVYLGCVGAFFLSSVTLLHALGGGPARFFGFFLAVLCGGMLLAWASSPNRLSLHGLYKECLVRTFLGASRLRPGNLDLSPPPEPIRADEMQQFRPRNPNPFNNVDSDDDLRLGWARSAKHRRLPLFIFNAALHRPASTGRTHEPFTFSPLFCGSSATGVGYADTNAYRRAESATGLTLGSAMAVSGAAISPVGPGTYNPLRAFVLGLLNARLGMWVGNPQFPDAIGREGPAFGGWTILAETLSIRSESSRFLHLSDGGYFENLGIYELVRRGCHRIVAIDAACDPNLSFGDLVTAMKRVKEDFGVRITPEEGFETFEPQGAGATSQASARGWLWLKIDYGRDCIPGRLLYLKSSLIEAKKMSFEVRHYARKVAAFPHESTTDQFFTDEQFDAYRLLGKAIAADAMASTMRLSSGEVDTALLRAVLRSQL